MLFRVKHNLSLIEKQVKAAQQEIERKTPDLLDLLGTQLMSLAQQAYRKKSRGSAGSDGISWAPLKRATLEARVRRRSAARRIVSQRKKLAEQINSTKGKNSGEKKQKLRQKRKDLSGKLQGLVNKEVSKHQIGVDTGLQRSSGSPGFSASDGKGGNIFDKQGKAITVGYNRTYSKHFDERRQLLPDPLPADWQNRLERKAKRFVDDMVKDLGERT